VQPLRTISAEDIKVLIKLLEQANDEYAEQDDADATTVEPAVLRESYPAAASKDELNTAGVFQACMYLFRDA
jgi:ATP-dependent DNA helicase 2 subunit 1